MAREETVAILKTLKGRRVQIEFEGGATIDVEVSSVDDEGFSHRDPDGLFWTKLDGVVRITAQK